MNRWQYFYREENMQTEASNEMIQFIDLEAQSKRIRTNIDNAIQNVLDHGMYIMGPEVFELEKEFQKFCDVKYAITCANGTDALWLILKALDIGPGDAVLVPSFTFAATAEVVALLGATPIIVDVLLDTYNMDPISLEMGIEKAKELNLIAKVVMTVDLFGQPAEYDIIENICKRHNLQLVCDAAQSFGAQYKKRKVGSIGIATGTSFYPAKPLGCYGDGGAIFTDNESLAEIILSLRVHGQGTHKYDNLRIGVNGRLDTIQAAILLEKLKIFPDEFLKRAKVAKRYSEQLKDVPNIKVPTIENLEISKSSWAQYTLILEHIDRDWMMNELKKEGIPTVIYYPRALHHQPAYSMFPKSSPDMKNSEYLAKNVLSLPMHPYLTDEQQDKIISVIKSLMFKLGNKENSECSHVF